MSVSSQFLRIVRSPLCICRYHQAVLQKSLRSKSFQRDYSTEPLPLPNQDAEKQYSPKIQGIVNEIGQLTLLEVADLNELLKKTLKIQDAPVMAMGAGAPMAAQPKEEEEEDVAAAAPKKSTFNVKLTGFDAEKKIALIKEIKTLLPDTNLVQAKKFVESAPVVVRGDLLKEEAEELMKALEKVGGKAVLE
ncbi:39S ribosomal protein L12, mitochondrial-like [Mercenaria mercenaria]|uniref:39S ribosomal protein L12, mitochondrial-like n=1 Tax=Mercenaria mercenaria TaxID=6596 RepID=UPI00234EF561|nr:39S ribosomal protein L12, mitochondrial-like [Mercenaria mercenaria]